MTACPTPQGRAAEVAPRGAPHMAARTHHHHPGWRVRCAGLLTAALLGVILLGASACGGEPASADSGGSGRLTVFASAVLTDAFTKLGDDFTAAHPGVQVVFNFSGAGELVAQMKQGASADVLATADSSFMEEAGDLVSTPRAFTANTLAIAVPPGNPEHITGLTDLSRSDLKVVLGSEETSIGRYSAAVLRRAGVIVAPVSLEVTVKGVVTKVSLGEADAGIVFVTDVLAADSDIDAVAIPASQNLTADYPVATVVASESPETAQAFIDLVLSPKGQKTLQSFGFLAPEGR
jgi:molybdate transport system substrate-binding protein